MNIFLLLLLLAFSVNGRSINTPPGAVSSSGKKPPAPLKIINTTDAAPESATTTTTQETTSTTKATTTTTAPTTATTTATVTTMITTLTSTTKSGHGKLDGTQNSITVKPSNPLPSTSAPATTEITFEPSTNLSPTESTTVSTMKSTSTTSTPQTSTDPASATAVLTKLATTGETEPTSTVSTASTATNATTTVVPTAADMTRTSVEGPSTIASSTGKTPTAAGGSTETTDTTKSSGSTAKTSKISTDTPPIMPTHAPTLTAAGVQAIIDNAVKENTEANNGSETNPDDYLENNQSAMVSPTTIRIVLIVLGVFMMITILLGVAVGTIFCRKKEREKDSSKKEKIPKERAPTSGSREDKKDFLKKSLGTPIPLDTRSQESPDKKGSGEALKTKDSDEKEFEKKKNNKSEEIEKAIEAPTQPSRTKKSELKGKTKISTEKDVDEGGP